MDKTLQQIANTIVANLKNTEPIGLFNGKIGICLFLYKYARYSGSTVYEEIASALLDDVFNQLKPNMSPSVLDGLGGIGYGLAILLEERLVESEPQDNVLNDIDNILLRDVRSSFVKELRASNPLYSSGMYLLSRLYCDRETLEQVYIDNVIMQANLILSDCMRQKKYGMLKLSLLNSMLHVFLKLSAMMKMEEYSFENQLRDILYLSYQAIRLGYYREIDMLLFQKNISQLSQIFKKECEQLWKSMEMLVVPVPQNRMDIWYDNLWWTIIYGTTIVEDISHDEIECYIDKKVAESCFDEAIVNSNLAAVGLWLMGRIS